MYEKFDCVSLVFQPIDCPRGDPDVGHPRAAHHRGPGSAWRGGGGRHQGPQGTHRSEGELLSNRGMHMPPPSHTRRRFQFIHGGLGAKRGGGTHTQLALVHKDDKNKRAGGRSESNSK